MKTRTSFAFATKSVVRAVGAITFTMLITAQGALAQSNKDITQFTIKKDRFNRIFIPAKIDKDTVDILFGTYSKPLRLTPWFLESGKLYPGWGRLQSKDKYGKRHSKTLFALPKLEIGKLKFRNEEAVVNQAFPDSIATGSAGLLMLDQYNWRIDNDRNQMSISKRPFTAERTYTTISYDRHESPSAVVSIGGINSDFVLDLASGAGFHISASSGLGRTLLEDLRLRPTRIVTSNIHSNKLTDTFMKQWFRS